MSKKALLVGINKYQIPGADLNGCVNDVLNVRDVLLRFYGFEEENIRVITDERATKQNIISRLNWLLDGNDNDIRVFHFSGHGSQVRDRENDELKDHLDEIICPHDMDWDGNFISDDELRNLVAGRPNKAPVEVILDSCHSGGMFRNSPFFNKAIKYRYLEPPVDIKCRVSKRVLRRSFQDPCYFSMMTACQENQLAADAPISYQFNGAFTYYLCFFIRKSSGRATRSELTRKIRLQLKKDGFDQNPCLFSRGVSATTPPFTVPSSPSP